MDYIYIVVTILVFVCLAVVMHFLNGGKSERISAANYVVKKCKVYTLGYYVVEVSVNTDDSSYVDFYLYSKDSHLKMCMFSMQFNFNDDYKIKQYIDERIVEYIEYYRKNYELK